MKTIIAASATGRRALHQPKRKFAHHPRPSHQRTGQPMSTKETKGEVVFTSMCLVMLLAFVAYFAWYLYTYLFTQNPLV
jgi:hypothetical protein